MDRYSVIVIGSGPGGYTAAISLAKFVGASHELPLLLIEEKEIGGVCLNEGCISTKTILASCAILKDIKRAREFGIEAENTPNVQGNFETIFKRGEQIASRSRRGLTSLIEKNNIKIISGRARFIEPKIIEVTGDRFKGDSIIIATGSKPLIPKSFKSEKLLTSSDALSLRNSPESLLIIGGGAIGVEFADIFNTLDTKVVLVEQMEQLLPELPDKESAELLKTALEKQGVKVMTGKRVSKIEAKSIYLDSGEKIEVSKVLCAIGRIPNLSHLCAKGTSASGGDGIEKIGIELDNNGNIKVDEYMQTNIEDIYAVGDVTGPPLLAYKASSEAIVASKNITGHNSKMDYRVIPNCIFSSPEIAWVGQLEGPKQGRFPYAANSKAFYTLQRTGFVKVVADKNGIVIGMEIVGKNASELIIIGTIAIKNKIKARDLGDIAYIHPTLSESLREAFWDIDKKAIHKLS